MLLDAETCYCALKARDARFDGRFFVGVTSTGIYCRPVCTVKGPKRENCVFYASAAEAEAAGFRPCLRCRPEQAPGNASVDARMTLARQALRHLEDYGVGGMAERLGVTARHLRRSFRAEWGVSPIEYAQTQRLLLAKQLLTDTRMPVTEVALAAGFGSVRRLHALFQKRYRLTPKKLRRHPLRHDDVSGLRFGVAFRPPYDWAGLLRFLGMRCIAGVDEVDGDAYRRVVRVQREGRMHCGWIEITPATGKATLQVWVSDGLRCVLPEVLARVKHLTDANCNPADVNERLGLLASGNPGMRVPGTFDGFEIAVRAILGQQVSVKAARTLLGRFVTQFGTPVDCAVGTLRFAFPTAEEIATLAVGAVARIGIPQARAQTVLEVARAIADSDISLRPGADVITTTERLLSLPGVGVWTAQYIAMRALRWPDAFPHTDLVLMRALGEKNPRRVLEIAEKWRPWRAYAVLHLWNSGANDSGFIH